MVGEKVNMSTTLRAKFPVTEAGFPLSNMVAMSNYREFPYAAFTPKVKKQNMVVVKGLVYS